MSCPALLELFAPELAEARKQAAEESKPKWQLEKLLDLVQKKYLSPEIGAKEAGLSLDDFNSKMSEYVMARSGK